jgi:hypothetical protein
MRPCVTVPLPIVWFFPRRWVNPRGTDVWMSHGWSSSTNNGRRFGYTWTRLRGGRSIWARLTIRFFWYDERQLRG